MACGGLPVPQWEASGRTFMLDGVGPSTSVALSLPRHFKCQDWGVGGFCVLPPPPQSPRTD